MHHLAIADRALIQIVDSALAEAARKSGAWLVCRPGCSPCCHGPFPINALDVLRLRNGLNELSSTDPARAARIRSRAAASTARLRDSFPGDPASGNLDESPEAEQRFEDFANDEPCPVLDPATGTCDLYSARPIPCRTFGPPVQCGSQAVAVCELCYHDATDEQVAACSVDLDLESLETPLVERTGSPHRTIVAFALRPSA